MEIADKYIATLTEDKIELLKRTICKGASNDELELFIHACNRCKLDPFMKQIYAVKRQQEGKEVMTIQTGIDGYRLIAERTGRYTPGRECSFTYKDGKVFSATAYVKKLGANNEWNESGHTVYWDEYAAKKKDGTLMAMWASKPHIMLGKCAEAAALRKAFPADLSGIYTQEELEHADVEEEVQVPVIPQFLSNEQVSELDSLIGEDVELLNRILEGYKISKLSEIPSMYFPSIVKRIKERKNANN